jgi:hypothetical protein
MTDSTVIEEQPHDVAATAAPGLPDGSSPPVDDLDSLLQEFDAKTAVADPPPESDANNVGQDGQAPNEIEQLLQEFQQPTQNLSAHDWEAYNKLTGEVSSLRAAEHRRAELEAFTKYADELQTQMPSWAPPDCARLRLESLAHDPTIAAAWDLRGADPKAANLELQKVQVALFQLQQNPAADPKQVQALQQYGQRLQVAVNSPAILRKARLDIINEARKLPKPIDEDATQVHLDVAAAVRGASGPLDLKDPRLILAR